MKILDNIINLISYKEPNDYHFILPDAENVQNSGSDDSFKNAKTADVSQVKDEKVFPSLSVNLEYVKKIYNFDINSDIKIREFYINVRGKQYSAFLLYIEGMIDSDSINRFLIKPLMIKNSSNTSNDEQNIVTTAITSNVSVRRVKKFDLKTYLLDFLVPQNDVSSENMFKDIFQKVNTGISALFVDTLDTAILVDAKGFETRSIEPPANENIIRGSQEGLVESLRINTTLLRRIINSENLIIEDFRIGNISQTQVAICYLKNVVNQELIKELKYRLNNLGIDYLISSGQLEQLIEDSDFNIPQLLSSERPDRVSSLILEGRVAILVNRHSLRINCSSCFNRFLK